MTKLYISYIFGLWIYFAYVCGLAYISSLNPWNFLSVKNDKDVFCCVNEVTFGNHLRLGADCQRSQVRGTWVTQVS